MAALVALLVFYPYLTKYTSNSMQEKISNLETKGNIAKKIVKIIYNNQSKEPPKNDQKNNNTKNKETGEQSGQ